MYAPKTITDAIKPMLWMNFLLGMGIFDFRRYPGKLIEYLYTTSFLTVHIVIYKFSFPYFDQYIAVSSFNLNRMMFNLIYYVNVILISFLIVASRISAPKLQTVIKLVETNDQKMKNMGLSNKYRHLFLTLTLRFATSGFIILIFIWMFYKWGFKKDAPKLLILYLSSVFYVPFNIIFVSNLSFCFWVSYLRMKFHQLNQLLQGMLTTTPDSPQHKRVLAMKYDFENKKFASFRNKNVRGSNGNVNTIRSVKQLHLELIKIARTMNSSYGVQLLLMMIIAFIFTTGLLYLFYRIVWMDLTTYGLLPELVFVVCGIFTYTSQIYVLNHICAKTCAEATNAGDIICELYEPSTSKEFRAEIRDFCLQLIQNPLVFTACGFFDLDHAFIQGIVGSITTYLVILIQVGDMTKDRFANSTIEQTANVTDPYY